MSRADDARELAGYVAPIVRGTSEALLRRRVKTYDRETGEVTGEVTMRQVIGGLAEVTALEIEVIDGKRPKHFTCDGCGKVFAMPEARTRKTCETCRTGGQTVCPCGCGKVPPRKAFYPSVVADRKGGPWTCRSGASREGTRRAQAARTPEQRSDIARKKNATMTPEQRSEAARKAYAAMTPEQRSDLSRKGNTTMTQERRHKLRTARTPEQRSEAARKAYAAMTPEQRSEAARKGKAAMTPEQRSEAARKGKAAMTPEQRSEAARKAYAAMTPEQRSESIRRAHAALATRTSEQRTTAARAAWETRRAAAVLRSRDGGEEKTGAGD